MIHHFVILILALLLLFAAVTDVFAYKVRKGEEITEEHKAKQERVQGVVWRAEGFVLNEKDHAYLALLLAQNYALLPDFDAKILSTGYLFLKVIKTNKFDVVFLEDVLLWSSEHSGLVSAKVKRVLEDVIWWSKARLKAHAGEFDALKTHAASQSEVEAVLSILSEGGAELLLQDWLDKGNFSKSRAKNLGLKFDLAIRKAKLVNVLNLNATDYEKAVIAEFKQSVIDVFPVLSKGSLVQHQHVQWIFKLMGKHRNLSEVAVLLDELIKEPLLYHEAQVEEILIQFPDSQIEEVKATILARLIINIWATEAKDPENPNSSIHFYRY